MKILCAIDSSEYANWAVETIGALFHQSLREVVLLHVIDSRPLRNELKKDGVTPDQINKVLTHMKNEGRALLETFEEKATVAICQSKSRPFVTIHPVLAHGHVAETIMKQAEKWKPDIIIMGSRGLSDMRGYLLGSTSRKVVAHAPCAVLTVKKPLGPHVRAVIAVDGSKASIRAANHVKSWGLPDTVNFHVLSVVPHILNDIGPKVLSKDRVKVLTERYHKRAREYATRYRFMLLKEGYTVKAEVLAGNPREVIVNFIEKQREDLAILGSKGLTGSDRFLMGSVSEWVAAYAPCSVLVVRPRTT